MLKSESDGQRDHDITKKTAEKTRIIMQVITFHEHAMRVIECITRCNAPDDYFEFAGVMRSAYRETALVLQSPKETGNGQCRSSF
jgi:hypothetical protein